jgi:chemotaxis protein methyltransferase CheR
VPPLRQRAEDVPLLVEHFVKGLSKKLGREITSVSPATLKTLREHSWPGNIRELANVVERAVINTRGPVLCLSDTLAEPQTEDLTTNEKTLEEVERGHVLSVLENTGWRIEGPSGAAKILGLNPSTLRTRMVKLGVQKQSKSLVET